MREIDRRWLEPAASTIRSLTDFFYQRDMDMAVSDMHLALEADPRDRRVLVAVDGCRVVGIIGYRRKVDAEGTYHLSFFGVADEYQRRGVGRMLYDRVEQDLRAHGARLLLAEASNGAYAAPARRFYEKCGFYKAATIPDYWQKDDPLALYVKRVDGPDTEVTDRKDELS